MTKCTSGDTSADTSKLWYTNRIGIMCRYICGYICEPTLSQVDTWRYMYTYMYICRHINNALDVTVDVGRFTFPKNVDNTQTARRKKKDKSKEALDLSLFSWRRPRPQHKTTPSFTPASIGGDLQHISTAQWLVS